MSKIAYFDCFSGISGDMLIAALLDAGLDLQAFESELRKLNLTHYEINTEKVMKQNIAATKFEVSSQDVKVYRHLKNLYQIVDNSKLDKKITTSAKSIFLKIAEAEAKIHNQPIGKVHFHEIGAVDTIIDVVGALVGIKLLGIEKVYCSKLNVGSGFVKFSHGTFPVPAPATAEILKGVPVYSTDSKGELITPTGAAIITTLSDSFGKMPEMVTESIGYGAGTRELERPNVLRVFVGQPVQEDDSEHDNGFIIETNIDDMNPQFYDHVMDKLMRHGALDVYFTNIMMKKNRPAIKLTVLTSPKNEAKLTNIIFEETTTLGVRIRKDHRKTLQREIKEVETKFGKIKVKVAKLNGKIVNAKPEYDDCQRIAIEYKIPLKQVYREIENLGISDVGESGL